MSARKAETPEQMEMLEEAGFTMGQGFLIGKPLIFDDLKTLSISMQGAAASVRLPFGLSACIRLNH